MSNKELFKQEAIEMLARGMQLDLVSSLKRLSTSQFLNLLCFLNIKPFI